MVSLEEEIDQIFIHERELMECNEIELIMEYIENSKDFMEELTINKEQVMRYANVHEFYKLKLETLSRELCDIEESNIEIDINMHNQQKVYDKIFELIQAADIKEEHFENLTTPDFEDLASIQISLHRLKTHKCDYNLKAVSDLREKVNVTLKGFMNKFISYFQDELNKLESESIGELRIHGHVYKKIKPIEFIIDFCKEAEPEKFVVMSQKYLKMAKNLYESEFEEHFEIVVRSLKDSKSRQKEKCEEIFGFVFESFMLILTSEEDFLKNYFFENFKFLNEAMLAIFSSALDIIGDFIKDCFRINNIMTISAIYKTKDIEVQYNIKHLEIYLRFKSKIRDLLLEYEKFYVNSIFLSWGYESKQKLVARITKELIGNSNEGLNISIINQFIEKIMDHKKDSKRGKVEFEIYRYKLLFMLESVEIKANKEKINSALDIVNEKFEREIITYIFTVEQKKMSNRISNVLKVIKDYFPDDQNSLIRMKNKVKAIVYDHVTQDFKKEVETLFK